ncbi:hypothetical protein P0136_11100 [Lentisphaerota bacterium ZTH]|nr:hypothetical protein JYG24_11380 [Lentisphaerota bacterium]WET05906.1 hypothetical protein P0136_11100 [Lentisphaerota bacterium ZTH]
MPKYIIKQPSKVKNCATCTFICSALELGVREFPISLKVGDARKPLKKPQLKSRSYTIDDNIIKHLEEGYFNNSDLETKNKENLFIDSIYAFMTDTKKLTYMHNSLDAQEFPVKNRGEVLPSGILNYIDFFNHYSKTKFSYDVYLNGCIVPFFLKYYFPDEYKLMFTKTDVKSCAPPKLKKNERMMVLVSIEKFRFNTLYKKMTCQQTRRRVYGHYLHWIMHRPDGSYMDPAAGMNYSSFYQYNSSKLCESIKKISFSGRFDLGLYIIIKVKDKLL